MSHFLSEPSPNLSGMVASIYGDPHVVIVNPIKEEYFCFNILAPSTKIEILTDSGKV